jgi:hypothetical protein
MNSIWILSVFVGLASQVNRTIPGPKQMLSTYLLCGCMGWDWEWLILTGSKVTPWGRTENCHPSLRSPVRCGAVWCGLLALFSSWAKQRSIFWFFPPSASAVLESIHWEPTMAASLIAYVLSGCIPNLSTCQGEAEQCLVISNPRAVAIPEQRSPWPLVAVTRAPMPMWHFSCSECWRDIQGDTELRHSLSFARAHTS